MKHTRLEIVKSRQRDRSQDGLILLSVLMVILMGTTIGMLAARDTRYLLRGVGHAREGVQGRYAAEAAMMSTITWFDVLDDRFDETVYEPWREAEKAAGKKLSPAYLPLMAEPNIPLWQGATQGDTDGSFHHAVQMFGSQMSFMRNNNVEWAPLTMPGETNGALTDPNGVYGPDQTRAPADFAANIYDCISITSSEGNLAETSIEKTNLRCLMTVSVRSVLSPMTYGDVAPGDKTKSCRLLPANGPSPADSYSISMQTNYHSTTASIMTLPVPAR